MTKEEFEAKDLQLRMDLLAQDRAEANRLGPVEIEDGYKVFIGPKPSEEQEPLAVKTKVRGGRVVRSNSEMRGNVEPVPVTDAPEIKLSGEALDASDNTDDAGEEGIDARQDLSQPPWMQPRVRRIRPKKVLGDISYPDDDTEPKDIYKFKDVPEVERKDGVIYRESPIREHYKKQGVPLSEQEIEKIEAMFRMSEHNSHRIRLLEPRTKADSAAIADGYDAYEPEEQEDDGWDTK